MKKTGIFIVAICAYIAVIVALNANSIFVKKYDFNNIDISISEENNGTYFNQLTDYQKKIYKSVITPISTAEERFMIKDANEEEFFENFRDAFTALQYDHPEYFWFTGGSAITSYQSLIGKMFKSDVTIEICPDYYGYVSSAYNTEKKYNQLMQKVKDVASLTENYSTDDFERIIFVHDYLIENAIYDHDALKEYKSTSHSPSCEYIYSAYGCLIDGKTVCAGFAKAFQLILTELGYDCSYVAGDAGGPHAWNCVYLDGDGYYIDVTWDNRDLENEIPFYNYALINDDMLKITHQPDTRFESPVCTATDYNYYIRKNYYLDKYNYQKLVNIISAQSENEAVYVKFKTKDDLEKAWADIESNVKKGKIQSLKSVKEAYASENHCTLTIIK